ncbi:MAG: menaquinol-cytochrome c reductase cytochrome b subunit [Egibacteraceae bacterium]
MSEPVEMDQKVYDELIAQGKSERIARAKAKAATVRAAKVAAGEKLGPRDPSERKVPAAAAAGAAQAKATAPGATAKARGAAPGVLTPEERQARVAAALAAKGNGGTATRQRETKLAGQEHTHRLLAMVPPTGIQQIRGKQDDKVYVWPHLLSSELICLLAVTALVTFLSILPAFPLRELANPNQTPNPSKAPWYFLGLQELLRYFHPMIAGVTIPGPVGLIGLAMIPYLDKNPSVRPENRKLAIMIMTFFLVGAAVVMICGSFFRGPGFNWVWPWVDGLYFEL